MQRNEQVVDLISEAEQHGACKARVSMLKLLRTQRKKCAGSRHAKLALDPVIKYLENQIKAYTVTDAVKPAPLGDTQ